MFSCCTEFKRRHSALVSDTMSSKFLKKPHIVFKEEDEGAFLFDPENGNLKYINHTGKELFFLLDHHDDAQQLVDMLIQRYPEAESHQLKADVTDFLHQLKEGGFIVSEEKTG